MVKTPSRPAMCTCIGVAREAKTLCQSGVTSVPRIKATSLHADSVDGCGAARGILFGLLLCASFWVGALSDGLLVRDVTKRIGPISLQCGSRAIVDGSSGL